MLTIPPDLFYNLFNGGKDFGNSLFSAIQPWMWLVIGITFVGILITALKDHITDLFYSIRLPGQNDDRFNGTERVSRIIHDHNYHSDTPAARSVKFEHEYKGYHPVTRFTYDKNISYSGKFDYDKTFTYDNKDRPNARPLAQGEKIIGGVRMKPWVDPTGKAHPGQYTDA